MINEICPVCQNKMEAGYQTWHFVCKHCNYERANFQSSINLHSAHALIDETTREAGLKTLRINNFKKILLDIESLKPSGGKLLDVGCAHGWFLELAKKKFDVHGLEPDVNFFPEHTRVSSLIRKGYFPDALEEGEKFDVIVFNDVIEHLPDIEYILASCRKWLNAEGLLVLNLPSSKGVFYNLSKFCCRLGYNQFFERLWQKNLPSPHVHYFNPSNMITLLKNNGFDIKLKGNLPTIGLSGLYARISYIDGLNLIVRILVYSYIVFSLPILNILPKDIMYVIAKRME